MNTRFYAVYDDLSFKPYLEFRGASASTPFFILEVKEHYKSGTDRDFEYRLWSTSKQEKGVYRPDGRITIGEWCLANVRSVRSFFDTEDIGFDVADPLGELRLRFFGKAISNNGIVKAIEFLKEMSRFESWAEFENQKVTKAKAPRKKTQKQRKRRDSN
jgi:hypothetical protein